MGEGRGHVPSLENVQQQEKRAATATAASTATATTSTASGVSIIKSQEQHVVKPPSYDVPSSAPQEKQPLDHTGKPSASPITNAATTTTTTTAPVVVRYRYQPGIYRFRCYGTLSLHQERPLRTIKAASLKNAPPTTSHMVCQGIATQLELIEPFMHAESAHHQFFQTHDEDHDEHHHQHHHPSSTSNNSHGNPTATSEPPLKLSDLHHPDDLEAFLEEQRAFVWTPHSIEPTTTVPTANTSDNTTTTSTTTTTCAAPTNSNPDKVWNTWTSKGATEVDLLVSRREGALFLNQGSMHWHMPPTKVPTQQQQQAQPQPQPPPSNHNDNKHQDPNAPQPHADESQILGVLPKPLMGIGKHEVGLQKDGTIYRGTYSQTSLMGILQISLYRMAETSVATTDDANGSNINPNRKALDVKTQASQLQTFWKKVLVNMKREVLFLKSEFSSDFGERWYKMSSRIVEKVPKTAEKTAQTIVKFVRGYWPTDD